MVLHVIKFEVTDLLESGARVFSANQNVGKSKPKTIPQLLLLLTNASFFFSTVPLLELRRGVL